MTSQAWDHGDHFAMDDVASGKASKTMHTGHPGVWLEWSDFVVTVDVSKGAFKGSEKKTIVHGSRGRVGPGEVFAVMGASGAGKTSLFNSLARRGTGYHVSGTATINGKPYSKEDLSKVGGFVFQEAVFRSHVKVEETLQLAADLKLPKSMSREEKNKRVQVLLDAFDLRKCANTKVGDSKIKGISGGEKKRLSIAIEVMRGESILFLDEPTTGLDSASSLMVIKLLRELADNGTTVMMVLHQPRASILKYIDTFLILSNGRDAYCGSLPNMINFFESVEMPIPLRVNPLDYVLDIVNTNEQLALLVGDDPLHKDDSTRSFAQILRGDTHSFIPQHNLREKRSLGNDPAPLAVDRKELAKVLSEKYRASGIFERTWPAWPTVFPIIRDNKQEGSAFHVRLSALLRREFTQKLRNPEVMATQLSGGIVLGLLMGSIYWQLNYLAVFNKMAGLSFAAVMAVFINFHVILTFPNDRQVWLRDRDNGLYSASEYYFSMVVAGLPANIVASFILATILYWMFGLNPFAASYFTFAGFFVLTCECAAALLYCGSAIAPSSSVANSLVSVILLFVMLFNGFFIVYSTIPVWYQWIATINFMRFTINVIYHLEFANQVYNCTVGVTPGCQFQTGNQVLINAGIPVDLEYWRMAVYIIIIMAIFHLLAWAAVSFCYTNYAGELATALKNKRRSKVDPMKTGSSPTVLEEGN